MSQRIRLSRFILARVIFVSVSLPLMALLVYFGDRFGGLPGPSEPTPELLTALESGNPKIRMQIQTRNRMGKDLSVRA